MVDECVKLRGRAVGLDLDGLAAKRARHEVRLIQQMQKSDALTSKDEEGVGSDKSLKSKEQL